MCVNVSIRAEFKHCQKDKTLTSGANKYKPEAKKNYCVTLKL